MTNTIGGGGDDGDDNDDDDDDRGEKKESKKLERERVKSLQQYNAPFTKCNSLSMRLN